MSLQDVGQLELREAVKGTTSGEETSHDNNKYYSTTSYRIVEGF